MVRLHDITKTYGSPPVAAVDGVSLSVAGGELFGVVGPDGAGKSTLFRILTTLVLPDRGSATVGTFDVVRDYREIRRRVGYMPGRFSLYQDLTVEENLRFFATLFGTTVEENYHLIRDIYAQIEPFKKRRAGKLSGGMKQKLALSCALIHKPEVLFLDEPTTGVDPVSRKEFWQMLRRLKDDGITVVVSTPYMDEATLCDRIALMQEGRVLAVDTPEGIINVYPEKLYAARSANIPGLLAGLRAYDNIARCFSFGEAVHLSFVRDDKRSIPDMLLYLEARGFPPVEVKPVIPSIEDCFIRLLSEH